MISSTCGTDDRFMSSAFADMQQGRPPKPMACPTRRQSDCPVNSWTLDLAVANELNFTRLPSLARNPVIAMGPPAIIWVGAPLACSTCWKLSNFAIHPARAKILRAWAAAFPNASWRGSSRCSRPSPIPTKRCISWSGCARIAPLRSTASPVLRPFCARSSPHSPTADSCPKPCCSIPNGCRRLPIRAIFTACWRPRNSRSACSSSAPPKAPMSRR